MKKFFVSIGSGLVARNIVQSGVLRKIVEKSGAQIIVLVPNVKGIEESPLQLLKSIQNTNIAVEIVPHSKGSSFERLFNRMVKMLIFTKNTEIRLQYHPQENKRKSAIVYFFIWIIFKPLSKFQFIKKLVRTLDTILFRTSIYGDLFEQHKPDVVFTTATVSQFDIQLLKEARRRKIKTVSMTKSWDNLDKTLFNVEPDLFLVQNNIMKDAVVKYQAFSKDKVRVVGFPQFDMYIDKSKLLSREEYCKRKGFDPTQPIVFLGSEGMWTCLLDNAIFESVITARSHGAIPPVNILIRPHFSALTKSDYSKLGAEERVYIDDKFNREPFFVDNWNQSEKDTIDFMNSLHHMDIMVMFASTLALDAACFDKPIIGIAYGTIFKKGVDWSAIRYETTNFQWVMESNPVTIVYSEDKFIEAIKHYINHPEDKRKERADLVSSLCNDVDGKSGERIAKEVTSLLV